MTAAEIHNVTQYMCDRYNVSFADVVEFSQKMLTVEETCKMLRISRQTLFRHTREGLIKSEQIVGRKMYLLCEIIRFREEQSNEVIQK